MQKPNLVIFDCDGVLVDSEGIFNVILARSLSAHGLPITPAECMALFVGGTMSNVKSIAEQRGAKLGPDWIDQVYEESYAEFRKGVAIIDGITELLDMLDANGISYCIGSNGRMAKMDITLGQNGLLDRFQGRIFSAYEVGIAKPDPGLFLHAAQKMGVNPARAIVIEDSLNGVTAANRAGIKCYGYAHEGDGSALAAQNATVIRSMRELPTLLDLTPIPQ